MFSQPQPLALSDAEFGNYQLMSYGSLEAPPIPSRVGFQLDFDTTLPLTEVVFGLVQEGQRSAERRTGFAVRIDLARGEIWDLINGSGLIGWLETPTSWDKSERLEAMLLSLEIERVGSALLPKLQIGGEEWLYPAIRSTETIEFTAVVGTPAESNVNLRACFSNPTVWSEDLRAFA